MALTLRARQQWAGSAGAVGSLEGWLLVSSGRDGYVYCLLIFSGRVKRLKKCEVLHTARSLYLAGGMSAGELSGKS